MYSYHFLQLLFRDQWERGAQAMQQAYSRWTPLSGLFFTHFHMPQLRIAGDDMFVGGLI